MTINSKYLVHNEHYVEWLGAMKSIVILYQIISWFQIICFDTIVYCMCLCLRFFRWETGDLCYMSS